MFTIEHFVLFVYIFIVVLRLDGVNRTRGVSHGNQRYFVLCSLEHREWIPIASNTSRNEIEADKC